MQIIVKELASGVVDVQWSIPKVIPPNAIPSPRLPAGCRAVGERTFVDQPSAWLTRQAYDCPEGVSGQILGVDFPFVNVAMSTLIRVELDSGAQYAHILDPGDDSWQVPKRDTGLSGVFRDSRDAVLAGMAHFVGAWVHIALALAFCLVGRVGLASTFFGGQVLATALASVTGWRIDVPLAEIGVALAVVLLAREALRPVDARKQLTALGAYAGVAHGFVVSGLAPDGSAGALGSLLFVLGMDAALLVSTTILAGVIARVPRRLVNATAYGVGGAGMALAIAALVSPPVVSAQDSERTVRAVQLPKVLTPVASTRPGSLRVATNLPDATFQSFVAVEAFEVRHEVLVRPQDVLDRIGIPPEPYLGVEQQDAVKERIRDLVLGRSSLVIDGEISEPISERVDFMTFDDQGALPRTAPVPELVDSAWVGVTSVYLTKTTAHTVTVTWEPDASAPEIPATVTDPETSRTEMLTAQQPTLRWTNELVEDPVPTVTAIAVAPRAVPLPLFSLVALSVALALLATALRGRRRSLWAGARLALALAVVVSPLGQVAVALPESMSSVPSTGETKRILAGVLPNVYRAFEFREESAAFDRLALSVTGDALTEIYLGHRRVLEMEERGGARARVEAVEVLDVSSIEAASDGSFVAEAAWTVGGTVTHFGHRHFRQNRFDARVAVVAEEDTWKIRTIEVLSEERLR